MARPGITYNEVSSAIDTLIARGEDPTINRIREELGTGSPNTIHRHLVSWRSSQPVAQRKAPELPPELQAAIVREFERQSADTRSEIERHLISAQKEAATLSKAGEDLEEANGVLEDENADLLAHKGRLQALSDERQEEIKNLNSKLDTERKSLEEAHIQVAQGRNKIESLEGEKVDLKIRIDQISDEYKLSEKGRIDSDKAAAVAEARLESEVKVSDDLRSQLANMTRKYDELSMKHDELSTESRSIQKENHLVSDKNSSLRRDLKDCENSYAIEHEKLQKLESRISEIETENKSLKLDKSDAS